MNIYSEVSIFLKENSTTIYHASIAVVTPIFRHSVLIVEALESVIHQQSTHPIVHIIVNDGCPHPETDAICTDYANAYPNQIIYLRKKNGGLSSARNAGIRFVLTHLPNIKALYFLDADNRLREKSLDRAYEVLKRSSEVDWIYPNIDMFGINWAGNYAGPYSVIVHSQMNICEAGSLIARRVFEAGVEFDEKMTQGFEDWDFFLSAAQLGFRGKNFSEFGFRYRKRPESMLADSNRDQHEIRAVMLRKHKALGTPNNMLSLEAKEAPRYCFYCPDSQNFFLGVDPDADGFEINIDELERRIWGHLISPSEQPPIPYIIVATRSSVDVLRSAGLYHWLLWNLENGISEAQVALATLSNTTESTYKVSAHPKTNSGRLAVNIAMISPQCMSEVITDQNSDWIDSLCGPTPQPNLYSIDVQVPASLSQSLQPPSAAPLHNLLALIHRIRTSAFRGALSVDWSWRKPGIPMRAKSAEIVRRSIGGGVVYPKKKSLKSTVGFLLPIVEFGGVERVALNIAREFKAAGWEPHLFLVERDRATITNEWLETFESINFLLDEQVSSWSDEASYWGTDIPPWASSGNHARAIGLFHWLDAIVNCHGAAMHGLMGSLRRLGIVTTSSLHLADMTPFGRPTGNVYLSLAYEHAYDVIFCCSRKLTDWCHAAGIPQDKLVTVLNAPSHTISDQTLRESLERKPQLTPLPLKVLFLGRLDYQKGLDRLAEVINNTATDPLISWRVIGKAIVDDTTLPKNLQRLIEPAITDSAELLKTFGWADVLVMLSHYEGFPLTILEAMRQGVVVITTDVGAVDEGVTDEMTGFLLKSSDVAFECTQRLKELAADKVRLTAMSEAAAISAGKFNWKNSTGPLIKRMTSILEKNRINIMK